jgi:uncharacterized protein YciI
MSKISFFLCLAVVTFSLSIPVQQAFAQTTLPTFYVVIYRKGPAFDVKKKPTEQEGIKGHVAYFQKLGENLVGASPFFNAAEDDPAKGMIIIKAESLEAAQKWAEQDPTVIAKTGIATVYLWRPVGWSANR